MKLLANSDRRGIALIIVMVCITVLAGLAGTFALSMKVETKLAMNANNESDLLALGKSGVAMAQWVLAQQMTISQEPYDSLNQKWAGGPGSMMTSNSPLADVFMDNIQLGKGSFSLKIVDNERKMNINTADQPLLDQAMRLIGIDAGDAGPITASILDWIDPDPGQRVGGTESDHYESLDPPYQAKNGPIDELNELLLIRGIADFPELYWGGAITERLPSAFQNRLRVNTPGAQLGSGVGLVHLFTPLSTGRLNLNTASATALQMIPFVDENVAARIIQCRSGPDGADGTEDDTPFRNPGEGLLCGGLNNALVGQVQRYCDVRSRTFEVHVDAQINGLHRHFFATITRNNPRDVQVLTFYWKVSPPPSPESATTSHADAR
jgi:type II secretory pathway component PulK